MIAFRRGVGSDSRNPHTPRLRSALRFGRLRPRTASATVEARVYSPAATMIHRTVGSATVAILIGAMTEVIQMAIALMITTKKPIVENSSRPVSGDQHGPGEPVHQDEDRGPAQEPEDAGVRSDVGDRGRGRPERERLRRR